MKKILLELEIDEQQEAALKELLPAWQQYKGSEGNYPFKDCTPEHLLEMIMYEGSKWQIWRRIKLEQCRQDMITYDEKCDEDYITIAERIAKRGELSQEGGGS
jgi:hypothetical protein